MYFLYFAGKSEKQNLLSKPSINSRFLHHLPFRNWRALFAFVLTKELNKEVKTKLMSVKKLSKNQI